MKHVIPDALDTPIKTIYHGIDDGKVVVSTYQDVEKIINVNKELQKEGKGYGPSRELRRVASIPLNILQMWAAQDGVNIFMMPRAEKMKYLRKKLSDPDWRFLRTSEGGL